jgi:hypothetical protein
VRFGRGNFPHSRGYSSLLFDPLTHGTPASEAHIDSPLTAGLCGKDVAFKISLEHENMVKAYRVKGKTETPRYKQLRGKLIELGNRNSEITSRNFAVQIGVFSESSARDWLAIFEADGIIKLVKRYQGGQKAYVLTNSMQNETSRSNDIKTQQNTTPKINLLNNCNGDDVL